MSQSVRGIVPCDHTAEQFHAMSQTKSFAGPLHERFDRILNSRMQVSLSDAGDAVNLKIVNCTYGVVSQINGEDVIKDIYNLNAMKVESAKRFAPKWAEAIAAEKAGDAERAEELFNEVLNKTQLSMGIINNAGTAQQFGKGEIVKCFLDRAEAADRDDDGNKLDTTHHTVVISSMAPIAAKSLTKKGFSFDDVPVEDEKPEEELAKSAKPAAAKPAAAKK